MAAIDREDLAEMRRDIREYMRERCDGIDARLDTLNGRTRKCETKIAVLEDRGAPGRDNTARGIGLGSIVAGVMTFLWQHFGK